MRLGSVWLWLWHRLAATAPIRPLAWEAPHVATAALKKKKRKKFNVSIQLIRERNSNSIMPFSLFSLENPPKDLRTMTLYQQRMFS